MYTVITLLYQIIGTKVFRCSTHFPKLRTDSWQIKKREASAFFCFFSTSHLQSGDWSLLALVQWVCLELPCAQCWLTQNSEAGRTGPHGSLNCLALKHCIIRQFNTLDSQMMLPWTMVANHCVTRVACSANTFVHLKMKILCTRQKQDDKMIIF